MRPGHPAKRQDASHSAAEPHLHRILIVSHLVPAAPSRCGRATRRPFSYRIKQRLTASGSQLLERLSIRQRPGVTTFRFWQEGPGYDRNLFQPDSILAAIDYVHAGPVRRGLVERPADWRWSSARRHLDFTAQVDPDLPTIHLPEYDLLH